MEKQTIEGPKDGDIKPERGDIYPDGWVGPFDWIDGVGLWLGGDGP